MPSCCRARRRGRRPRGAVRGCRRSCWPFSARSVWWRRRGWRPGWPGASAGDPPPARPMPSAPRPLLWRATSAPFAARAPRGRAEDLYERIELSMSLYDVDQAAGGMGRLARSSDPHLHAFVLRLPRPECARFALPGRPGGRRLPRPGGSPCTTATRSCTATRTTIRATWGKPGLQAGLFQAGLLVQAAARSRSGPHRGVSSARLPPSSQVRRRAGGRKASRRSGGDGAG